MEFHFDQMYNNNCYWNSLFVPKISINCLGTVGWLFTTYIRLVPVRWAISDMSGMCCNWVVVVNCLLNAKCLAALALVTTEYWD